MRRISVLLAFAILFANRLCASADDTVRPDWIASCGACQDCCADVDSVFGGPGPTLSTGRIGSIEQDSLWDNLSIITGLEGSKQPQDYGVNAHFGGRVSANLGLPLCGHIGLGLQVGTSINYTDNAVQVFDRLGEVSGRSQSFTTLGVFQRLDNGVVWAAAWDFLHQNYLDQTNLNQARGRIGWQFGNEEISLRARTTATGRSFWAPYRSCLSQSVRGHSIGLAHGRASPEQRSGWASPKVVANATWPLKHCSIS